MKASPAAAAVAASALAAKPVPLEWILAGAADAVPAASAAEMPAKSAAAALTGAATKSGRARFVSAVTSPALCAERRIVRPAKLQRVSIDTRRRGWAYFER